MADLYNNLNGGEFQPPTPNETAISNGELAQALALRGWLVFPCKPGKSPATKRGFRDATRDLAIIRAWWSKSPGALIGIACAPSGFFALDVDMKSGVNGWQALTELQATHGRGADILVGPIQRTPSGGAHLLFRLPDGLDIPNNAGKLGPGLDLRSAGYICSGSGYTWQPDHNFISELTPAPDWLLALIRNMGARPAPQPSGQPATQPTDAGDYWLHYFLGRATVGNRNQSGFELACQLRDSGVTQAQAEGILQEYARRVPGDDYNEREALSSLRSAFQSPRREAARLPGIASKTAPSDISRAPEAPGNFEDAQQAANFAPGDPATFADIAGVLGPITWAWPGWLADGFLHIIASEPGKGKSALCLRLAACYLQGRPWPDSTKFTGELGAALWAEAEAGQAVNLDRAKKWGLPLERILTPFPDPLTDLSLDLDHHKSQLQAIAARPDVRIVIIDSLRGIHGGDEKDSALMGLVRWLAELARNTGKPFLLTHHLRKRGLFDGDGINLDRVRGTTAIVQPARLVWAIDEPDPYMQGHLRLSVIKSNLAKSPQPVGMRIDESGPQFGLAPEAPRTESLTDQAADLLLSLLEAGPLPFADIETARKAKGLSERTLDKAKARLGIVSIRKGGREGGWLWSLPASPQDEYVN